MHNAEAEASEDGISVWLSANGARDTGSECCVNERKSELARRKAMRGLKTDG